MRPACPEVEAMARAYMGLGSNEGDRMGNLRGGLRQLAACEEVIVVATSGVYESEPVGVTDQPDFLNAVVAVETALEPEELLELAFAIERNFGRRRLLRWGPRTLDVDILLMEGVIRDDPVLTIPHPRLKERRFVLEPLLEIEPSLRLPDGVEAKSLLEGLRDVQQVWRVGDL